MFKVWVVAFSLCERHKRFGWIYFSFIFHKASPYNEQLDFSSFSAKLVIVFLINSRISNEFHVLISSENLKKNINTEYKCFVKKWIFSVKKTVSKVSIGKSRDS